MRRANRKDLERLKRVVEAQPFEVDLRFMKGAFVARDGRRRHAAFALI